MTKLLIEYLRPNGQTLRFVDLGTAFMESEGIPLSNALRPVRDEAEAKLSKKGNFFFDFAHAELPLPDGLDTVLRIKGTTVTMSDIRLSNAGNPTREGKAFVALNGVYYEISTVLTKGRHPYWVKVHGHKASQTSVIRPRKEAVAMRSPANEVVAVSSFAPTSSVVSHQPNLPFMSRSASITHCPKCGSRLVRKQITLSSKVRHFLACSSFPECRFTRDA